MYDDYMAGPEVTGAMESGDADAISTVLNTLRKICNHPRLSAVPQDTLNTSHFPSAGPAGFPTVFPRLSDDHETQPHVRAAGLLAAASSYDPMKHVDLRSLNMVYFAHEFNLTAITSDRVRKCCAPRALIEELHTSRVSKGAAAPVPAARLRLEIQPSSSAVPIQLGQHKLFLKEKCNPIFTKLKSFSHFPERIFARQFLFSFFYPY